MRTTSASIALLVATGLLVACGDGIDERYDGAEPGAAVEAPTTTSTAPEELPEFEVERFDLELDDSRATFSGVRNIVQLDDGSWLLSGFDNHSDLSQPEPGAVWHSDDLQQWQRIGESISEADNQQVIDTLVAVGGTVIAAGSDYERYGPDGGGEVADAAVWISTDDGRTFDRELLSVDASVDGAAAFGDEVWVWGFQFDDDLIGHGQIWRSVDQGATWAEMSPSAAPGPGLGVERLGPIVDIVQWGDSIVAVGIQTDTDPEGGYPLDDVALGSPTVAWEPVDVGIWYSDDSGSSWRAAAPTGVTGERGAQLPIDAIVVDDQLVMLGAAGQVADPIDFTDFDPDNPDDFEFEFDADRFIPTIWVCDQALQACAATPLHETSFDRVGGALVEADGVVAVGVSLVDFDQSQGPDLGGWFRPSTGQLEVSVLSEVEQVGALTVVDGTLYLFGRNVRGRVMTAATTDLPD
ncbi:MAG: sialidase family protein [Actinomycetota bacterium]|nr:sialidase family protein [Actinomycetota bacterium]